MKVKRSEFMALAKLEPKLLALLADIDKAKRAAKDNPHACANRLWIGRAGDYSFKDRLCELVGFHRGQSFKPKKVRQRADDSPPKFEIKTIPASWLTRAPKPPSLPPKELGTSEAYDSAYHYLYSRLPDCGDCLCARLG
jgi:hypothetical protein